VRHQRYEYAFTAREHRGRRDVGHSAVRQADEGDTESRAEESQRCSRVWHTRRAPKPEVYATRRTGRRTTAGVATAGWGTT